jgi:hypothetical protein
MDGEQEQNKLKRDKVLSEDPIAEGKDLTDGTVPSQSPLNTFFALAGGARFLWGTELHDAHGKDIEQLIAEDLGEEEDKEVIKKLQQYKEEMLEVHEGSNDDTNIPTK